MGFISAMASVNDVLEQVMQKHLADERARKTKKARTAARKAYFNKSVKGAISARRESAGAKAADGGKAFENIKRIAAKKGVRAQKWACPLGKAGRRDNANQAKKAKAFDKKTKADALEM